MGFRENMQAVSADIVDAFGETAYFTGVSGPYSIQVIFDPGEVTVDPYTGQTVVTPPQIVAKSSDVTGAKHKDSVEVDGQTYEITESRPDGYGATILTLNKT